MKYITSEFYNFFKDLAANNNREWFNAHKEKYTEHVFNPFKSLTENVIKKMSDIDPNIQITYKDAAFRIYRDIRFSADKSPYKLWMGAVVNRIGRKNSSFPEIYFQFGPGENFIAGGLYQPDKEILYKIREYIARHPKTFDKINNDEILRKYFPEGFQGERNKRLTKEWMKIADQQAFILNKNFYTFRKYRPEEIMIKNLDEFIVSHYQAMQKWNSFLIKLNT